MTYWMHYSFRNKVVWSGRARLVRFFSLFIVSSQINTHTHYDVVHHNFMLYNMSCNMSCKAFIRIPL